MSDHDDNDDFSVAPLGNGEQPAMTATTAGEAPLIKGTGSPPLRLVVVSNANTGHGAREVGLPLPAEQLLVLQSQLQQLQNVIGLGFAKQDMGPMHRRPELVVDLCRKLRVDLACFVAGIRVMHGMREDEMDGAAKAVLRVVDGDHG